MLKHVTAITALCFLIAVSANASQLKIEQFVSPETCGDCHVKIYDQWKNSMHNLSHNDPVYNTIANLLLSELTDKNEIAEGESCIKCHTPVGNITGYPLKLSDDQSKVPVIAQKGIQCDYCHSATGISKPYNNGLILQPGNGEDDPGIKRGPYEDASSDFHETGFSAFHTQSEICGTCHDVKHVVFNTPLETTYTEWKKSPYNSEDANNRVTCQGCHMYQRPGVPATGSTQRPANKGQNADEGPVRDHVFTHHFVGGNSTIPKMSGDTTKEAMVEERLKNAATLSVNIDSLSLGRLYVTIKNTGAGHFLPTGLTDVRQMWLSVEIQNANNKKIFSSGLPDKNGYLDEKTTLYNTVFGDGKGKPVSNLSKAMEILSDNRIPPLESVTETFSFRPLKKDDYKITVKLLYRSASQKLLDKALGKHKINLPIIEMNSIAIH
jgi:hypothetical protein